MSRNCYDNAVMESFFSTVKSELADRFDTYGDAKMELFDYIEVFYNQRRRHSTLGRSVLRHLNDARTKRVWILWKTAKDLPQAPHPLSFSMSRQRRTMKPSTESDLPSLP